MAPLGLNFIALYKSDCVFCIASHYGRFWLSKMRLLNVSLFLRWSMLQDFSSEIMKLFIENKLDQNMQHVTLSSMQSAIELYKLLVFEKLA